MSYCEYCMSWRGHKATCPAAAGDVQPEITDWSIEAYREFLSAKAHIAKDLGFAPDAAEINTWLKPHQQAVVRWAVAGGRRAIFASFGLGKTVIQLEVLRLIIARDGGRALIVAPLGVRQEFRRDALKLGIDLNFIRSIEEAGDAGIYLTNYETVRDGKIDPKAFTATSLDEASVLRGFGGTKTFREFMRVFEGVKYRFVATATPDPNEYIELLAYAAYLGIMDVSGAKTRFFKRDSTKADKLTIHPHKEQEFWVWVASWAMFLRQPSDLGFADEGYSLPEMQVITHELPVDHTDATPERDGQGRMFREALHGVVDAAREKRETLPIRIAKMQEILAAEPDEHFLIWHDLESEREAIESAVPDVVSVYGSQNLEEREASIVAFSDGEIQHLAAKPVIAGSGCNFQRHCARAIFLGIGFKFNDFIQAIHRIFRFLQTRKVEIHIIYAESERRIYEVLMEKWERHKKRAQIMSEMINTYGLSQAAMIETLKRSLGIERIEIKDRDYTIVNNDCVEESARMADNSLDLILTSIPFSTQYEYSPSYNDFGHTDNNEHFWQQMGFLIPQLLRTLKPGRLAAIHVKDRIVPGGVSGLGFQTVYPFHADCIRHFVKHGFAFMGQKTIVTDVVRENNQTYRLGWTEQCKDGSKMGYGMPEYLLLFRKPPSDSSDGYADQPVRKSKDEYSRGRWQMDAHGFARSSGNRPLTPEDLKGLSHAEIFQLFKKYSMSNVYDFENHVALAEALEGAGILPVTFMLLQPQSWHPDVWTDITRMRTLNGAQSAKGKEMHLCPLQFDICDRVIAQNTMPGETVYDPFGGLMTVPYCAIQLGRKAIASELNPAYFVDGLTYVRAASAKAAMPTLFDLVGAESEGAAA